MLPVDTKSIFVTRAYSLWKMQLTNHHNRFGNCSFTTAFPRRQWTTTMTNGLYSQIYTGFITNRSSYCDSLTSDTQPMQIQEGQLL